MKTILTEMLKIKYPIFCGGLYGLSDATLVSAVSEAGGLGFLSSSHMKTAEQLKIEIKKTKLLTKKPFGVNISMLQESKSDLSKAFLAIIISEEIPVVETSGNDPSMLIEMLRPHGIKIIHKVVSVRHALKAAEAGADAITIVGYSAGGHPGMFEHGLWVNLQDALMKLDVPIIAAGGIYDGKGFASALCMGAQGILMGTAFALSQESLLSEEIKKELISADIDDTVVIFKTVNNAFRCYHNERVSQVLAMEQRSASPKELFSVLKDTDVQESYRTGNSQDIIVPMGKIVGLIQAIKPCKVLIEEMVNMCQDAVSMTHKLSNL